MKIAIVTDTGANLKKDEIEKYNIFVLPLQITDENTSYLFGQNIDNDKAYDLIETQKVLKTSQPPIGLIEEMFLNIKKQGYEMIFAIPICGGLSSTISTMYSVAQQVNIPFEYFDCYTSYNIQGYLVRKAVEYLAQGKEIKEIKEKFEIVCDKSSTILIPIDLNHFVRGGRLTKGAALLANLLKICPIMICDKNTGGKVDNLAKTRTLRKAMDTVIEYMKAQKVDGNYMITVADVRNEKGKNEYVEKLKAAFPDCHYDIEQLNAVIGVHTGIGCLGLQYIYQID